MYLQIAKDFNVNLSYSPGFRVEGLLVKCFFHVLASTMEVLKF